MTLSDWGIDLTFIRTKVGKEFDVVNSSFNINSDPLVHVFCSYGYFDLVSMSIRKRMDDSLLIPVNKHILDVAPFRFFSFNNDHKNFIKNSSSWNSAIVVLIKIQPEEIKVDGYNIIIKLSNYLEKFFENSAIFWGIGYSELVVLTGGDNLELLLDQVTNLREDDSLLNLCKSTLNNRLILNTTTFPLISCNNICIKKNYDKLDGKIEPFITLTHEPLSYSEILRYLPIELKKKSIYGKSDLLLYWEKPVSVSFFSKTITSLRMKWGELGLVSKTNTYLEKESNPQLIGATYRSIHKKRGRPKEVIRRVQEISDHYLKSLLSELILHLFGCFNNPHVNNHYYDLENSLNYISDIIEDPLLNQTASIEEIDEAKRELIRSSDYIRSAITQRYSGLESHPETLAFTPSTMLCDIRIIISAITALPYFIYDNLYKERKAKKIWAGFVLFGHVYTPSWIPMDILAMPASFIYSPIENWWKITHEVGHSVFSILEINHKLPKELHEYYYENSFDGLEVTQLLTEVFANWFDWRYIFNSKTNLYLQMIWESWLHYSEIHDSKVQYLSRTFAIYLCNYLTELLEARQSRRIKFGTEFMNKKWEEFIHIVGKIDGMDTYITDINDKKKDDIFDLIHTIEPFLHYINRYFEKDFGLDGLMERLNPKYDNINNDIKAIKNGNVVLDGLLNPIKVILELKKDKNVSITSVQINSALIYSFDNFYQKKINK